MHLNIAISDYIERKKLKPILNTKGYNIKTGKIDPNGLFSEEIFGRLGSRERKKNFAYIDLHCKIIHPEAYAILTGIDPRIGKILSNQNQYILSNGTLIEDKSGKTGIHFFTQIFDQINWDSFKSKKIKEVEFIKNNKQNILIEKLIVIPAGIRDIRQMGGRGNLVQMQSADINNLYDLVISKTSTLTSGLIDEEISSIVVQNVQRLALDINKLLKEKIKGKQGLIRGGLLSKRIDYSARLIISPDPKLKLGFVGIPWQIVLKLYEPFVIHELLYRDKTALTMIQSVLESEKVPDVNDLKRFLSKLNEDPTICPIQLKEYFIQMITEIVKDKVVIYKRD